MCIYKPVKAKGNYYISITLIFNVFQPIVLINIMCGVAVGMKKQLNRSKLVTLTFCFHGDVILCKAIRNIFALSKYFSCHQTEEKSNHLSGADCLLTCSCSQVTAGNAM